MERDLRALADRLGANVAAVHVDDGLSGGIRNRPAFREWLTDAHERRADILAAWSIDRMTREGVSGGGADILDTIEATGVRLVDTQGTDSTTPGFRLGFVVKAEVAREELQAMRRRSRARSERAAAAGQWSAGVAPYGYRIVRVDGRPTLTIVKAEADVILDAARRVIVGEPVARIVRDLNTSRVLPRSAKHWTSTSLMRVLTGNTVRGHATFRGELLRDADGMPRDLWPAILTPDVAAQVTAWLAPKPGRGRPVGARANARLLSGLLRCATCGRVLRASSNNGVARYACSAPQDQCAGRASVNAAKAERWAETELLDDFMPLMFTETVPTIDDSAVKLAQLDEAIAAALGELATAATPEVFARLQALQARRAEVEAEPATAPKFVTRSTGRTIGEEFERRDIPGRRDLIAKHLNLLHIELRPATWPHEPVADRLTPLYQVMGEDDEMHEYRADEAGSAAR
jgi:DNA invertase Pin-like site-specific DNA recombinase